MATIPAPVLRHVRKTIAFDGGATSGQLGGSIPAFTATGGFRVIEYSIRCTETLVCSNGAGTSLALFGVSLDGDELFRAVVDGATAGQGYDFNGFWTKTPFQGTSNARAWDALENLILLPLDEASGADITDGTVVIDLWGYPITDDGALTGDDASEAYLPADVQRWLGTTAQGASGRPQVDVELIEGADPSDTIRDAIVDDATRIDASQLNTHTAITAAGIADAVWDEAAAGHTDAGKAGEQLWTDVDAIQADTEDIQSRLPAALVSGRIDATVDATGMESGAIDAILTRAMTESYNADGAAPTLAQALFAILQRLTEFSISGTTITVKKLDGSTSAFTLTLDSAGSPTSSTRAT